MATDSSAYCSLDFCKSYLGDEGIDTGIDQLICNLINNVSRFADSYIGEVFYIAGYTEYFDGDNTDRIIPEHYPVNLITSLHSDEDRVFDATTLIDSTSYVIVDKIYVRLLDDEYFETGIQNIKLVYQAGPSSVPLDLQQACAEIVAWKFKEGRGGGDLNVQSKTRTDSTTTYFGEAIPKSAKAVLDRYKRLSAC